MNSQFINSDEKTVNKVLSNWVIALLLHKFDTDYYCRKVSAGLRVYRGQWGGAGVAMLDPGTEDGLGRMLGQRRKQPFLNFISSLSYVKKPSES